jgi:hypothetical protein
MHPDLQLHLHAYAHTHTHSHTHANAQTRTYEQAHTYLICNLCDARARHGTCNGREQHSLHTYKHTRWAYKVGSAVMQL